MGRERASYVRHPEVSTTENTPGLGCGSELAQKDWQTLCNQHLLSQTPATFLSSPSSRLHDLLSSFFLLPFTFGARACGFSSIRSVRTPTRYYRLNSLNKMQGERRNSRGGQVLVTASPLCTGNAFLIRPVDFACVGFCAGQCSSTPGTKKQLHLKAAELGEKQQF